MDANERNALCAEMGRRFRQARKARRISIQELSNITGVSINSIRQFEVGTQNPTALSLFRLALALNISLDWLAGINPDAAPVDVPDVDNIRHEIAVMRNSLDRMENLLRLEE